MSAQTVVRTGSRFGGLLAALALMGAVGVGSASAADAQEAGCLNGNPHINCTPGEPMSEGEQEFWKKALPCAVTTGVTSGVATPIAGAAAGGTCAFNAFVN